MVLALALACFFSHVIAPQRPTSAPAFHPSIKVSPDNITTFIIASSIHPRAPIEFQCLPWSKERLPSWAVDRLVSQRGKRQNEAHDMAPSLSIAASPPLQHNTWLPDARQIIARCAVRWRSLRGELLPDDRKHFQQDYTVEGPGFLDGNRRHRWTGRHRGRAIRSSQPSAYRLYVTQDEYSILNSKHFIGIHGYMLVYSVSSLPSFEMVQIVREKILNHLVGAHLPLRDRPWQNDHRWHTCLEIAHRVPNPFPSSS